MNLIKGDYNARINRDKILSIESPFVDSEKAQAIILDAKRELKAIARGIESKCESL